MARQSAIGMSRNASRRWTDSARRLILPAKSILTGRLSGAAGSQACRNIVLGVTENGIPNAPVCAMCCTPPEWLLKFFWVVQQAGDDFGGKLRLTCFATVRTDRPETGNDVTAMTATTCAAMHSSGLIIPLARKSGQSERSNPLFASTPRRSGPHNAAFAASILVLNCVEAYV